MYKREKRILLLMPEYVLGGAETQLRYFIEYAETKEGEACVGDDCRFYYATISLGELS